jgi:hypothetical protein
VDECVTSWQPRSKNRVATDPMQTELEGVCDISVLEAIKQRETIDPGAAN